MIIANIPTLFKLVACKTKKKTMIDDLKTDTLYVHI